jgi:hypothetical protein
LHIGQGGRCSHWFSSVGESGRPFREYGREDGRESTYTYLLQRKTTLVSGGN